MSQDEFRNDVSISDSQGFRRIKHDGLTIEGYSRAAVQTFWRIPEYKLGFDLGWQPWSFMGMPRWFITHTHMDHILALPAYLARRRMMKMEPPSIYLPKEKVEDVQELLKVFTRLDRGHLPCRLIGVLPGDTLELSRELIVTVGRTRHTVPSVCYTVWERRKKLKEEYQGLSEQEIRDLNLSGIEVSREIRQPKIAYLGDSSIQGLDNNPVLFEAEVLITEMTFIAPQHRREALNCFGHLHINDFVERQHRFKNQLILAAHFSTRYNNKEIMRIVRQQLPDMLNGRLQIWI